MRGLGMDEGRNRQRADGDGMDEDDGDVDEDPFHDDHPGRPANNQPAAGEFMRQMWEIFGPRPPADAEDDIVEVRPPENPDNQHPVDPDPIRRELVESQYFDEVITTLCLLLERYRLVEVLVRHSFFLFDFRIAYLILKHALLVRRES